MRDRSVLAGVGRILLAVVFASLGTLAAGQVPPGLDAAMRPDYQRRDMAVMVQVLELDDTQAEILQGLFQDYEAAFREGLAGLRVELAKQGGVPLFENVARDEAQTQARAEVQVILRDLRERAQKATSDEERRRIWAEGSARLSELRDLIREDDPTLGAELMRERAIEAAAVVERWREQKRRLMAGFEDGIRAVLGDRQLDRWPAMERRLRKQKTLGRGQLSGESVDVRALALSLHLSPDDLKAIGPILDRYDVELDAALRARNDAITAGEHDLTRALQEKDRETIHRILEAEADRRVAVRDLNERYAAEITETLPDDLAIAFRDSFRTRAYARVYRMSRGQRVFLSALEQLEMDADTVAAVEALHADYMRELQTLNGYLVNELRRSEPREAIQRADRRLRVEPDDAAAAVSLREAFARRTDLDRRYLDQLELLITDEQAARLPGLRPAAATATASDDPRSLPTLPERWKRLSEMFDRNRDGRLDADEREAALKFLETPFPKREDPPGNSKDGGG